MDKAYTIYFYDLDEYGDRYGNMKSIVIVTESLDFALDIFKNDARSFHTEIVGMASGGVPQ